MKALIAVWLFALSTAAFADSPKETDASTELAPPFCQLADASSIGQCMGDCASEQGMCMGNCSSDQGICIGDIIHRVPKLELGV